MDQTRRYKIFKANSLGTLIGKLLVPKTYAVCKTEIHNYKALSDVLLEGGIR